MVLQVDVGSQFILYRLEIKIVIHDDILEFCGLLQVKPFWMVTIYGCKSFMKQVSTIYYNSGYRSGCPM